MNRWFISIALAFLLCGIAEAIQGLTHFPVRDRPGWAQHPTLAKAAFGAATWFVSPFLEIYYSTGQKARAVAFGALGATTQMGILTGLSWLCISAATHIFDNTILQVASTAVFLVVGVFVMPWVNLILVPLVTLILGWPLGLLFPLKGTGDARAVRCCLNCKYYRRSRDFGDILGGLWQSETMPRSDKLPCRIALETSEVWLRYYSCEPHSRPSFPVDCPFFEGRA
jgi:hypothetical protein